MHHKETKTVQELTMPAQIVVRLHLLDSVDTPTW